MMPWKTDVKPLKQFAPWKCRIGILFLLLLLALVNTASSHDASAQATPTVGQNLQKTNDAHLQETVLPATTAANAASSSKKANLADSAIPDDGPDAAENFKQRVLLLSLMTILIGAAVWHLFFRRSEKSSAQ
jgi:hypothetical protein